MTNTNNETNAAEVPSDSAQSPCSTTIEIPEELYGGYDVHQELTDNQRRYTSHENVSAVLDAVVRLIKRNRSVQTIAGENRNLRSLLSRYRKETPIGNQPHMIAEEVDAVLNS